MAFFTITLVNRADNEEEDAFTRLVATPCPPKGRWIQIEHITMSSVMCPSLNLITSTKEEDWSITLKST